MGAIQLTPIDLGIASALVLVLAFFSLWQKLQVEGQLVISAIRAMVQLLLIGFILKFVFSYVHLLWIIGIACIMLLVATREVLARQHYRLQGWWGAFISFSSLFLSTLSTVLFTLLVIVGNHPWYQPQYAIPLLGMILGNTMTGLSLSIESLLRGAWYHQETILQRLALGQAPKDAISDIHRDAIRVGLIPTINAMATAGLVSLPGMMTGQILAGSSPIVAVQYQILILFLITVSTGCAILLAIRFLRGRLFDERARLRLDRVKAKT